MSVCALLSSVFFFFFHDTPTTKFYTLSLHDALPISIFIWLLRGLKPQVFSESIGRAKALPLRKNLPQGLKRSEEHTSELQSRQYLVCRLLLEKKKKYKEHNLYIYCNTTTDNFVPP